MTARIDCRTVDAMFDARILGTGIRIKYVVNFPFRITGRISRYAGRTRLKL